MDDTAVIKEVVAASGCPASVKDVRVGLGSDSTNEPAAWIILTVDDDIERSSAKLTELNDFASKLTTQLIERLPNRWPYVEISVEPVTEQHEPAR